MRAGPAMPRLSLGRMLLLLVVALALAAPQRAAAAEAWPARPITLVVPFPAGGSMDFLGRSIGQHLTELWGQPVVIDNRVGAGGVIATNYVAKAAPDGYTFLISAIGPAVFRPIIDRLAGYDMDKDFAPVIMLADSPNVLLASPKLGLRTVQDLLAYARQKQNKLSIAHSGPGTMGQLCAALFASQAHIDGSFIAYRGAPPMLNDLLGGQIDIGFPAFGPGSQTATILAVTTAERVDFLPGVPTMRESGFDLVGSTWNAIFAPARVPREIVDKLNAAIDAHLRKPQTQQQFRNVGLRALGGTPEQLRESMAQDHARWAKLIVELKLDADK